MLLWDAGEVGSMGLPDQVQNVSILVVSAGDGSEKLDLLKTTCKVLRIPKASESICARQNLMAWFRSVMTAWVYMCMNLRSVICPETRRAISHSS